VFQSNEFDLYIGRLSTIETQVEDEHEQTMTHSLIIAHQCTVETLERLEDEDNLPFSVDSPGLCPPSFNNQKSQLPLCSPDTSRKRASVWINDLIFKNACLPPGFRRHTWVDTECLEFLNQQPHYFLRKWTDQGANLDEVDEGMLTPRPYPREGQVHHYNQSSTVTPPISPENTYSDRISKIQDGMVYSGENTNAEKIDSLVATTRTEPPGMFFATSGGIC
jgi:hypothetical protein